jgi:hypothetical protein
LSDTENKSDLLFIRFAVLFSSRAFIPVFHLPLQLFLPAPATLQTGFHCLNMAFFM